MRALGDAAHPRILTAVASYTTCPFDVFSQQRRSVSSSTGLLAVERPLHVPQQLEAPASHPDASSTISQQQPHQQAPLMSQRPDYVPIYNRSWADKLSVAKLQQILQTYPTVLLHPKGGAQAQYICVKLLARAAQFLKDADADKRVVFFVIRLRSSKRPESEDDDYPRLAFLASVRQIDTLPAGAAASTDPQVPVLRPARKDLKPKDGARRLHKALQACLQNPQLQQAKVHLMGPSNTQPVTLALNTVRHVLRSYARQNVLVMPSFVEISRPVPNETGRTSFVLQLHAMAQPMPADEELVQQAARRPPLGEPVWQAAAEQLATAGTEAEVEEAVEASGKGAGDEELLQHGEAAGAAVEAHDVAAAAVEEVNGGSSSSGSSSSSSSGSRSSGSSGSSVVGDLAEGQLSSAGVASSDSAGAACGDGSAEGTEQQPAGVAEAAGGSAGVERTACTEMPAGQPAESGAPDAQPEASSGDGEATREPARSL